MFAFVDLSPDPLQRTIQHPWSRDKKYRQVKSSVSNPSLPLQTQNLLLKTAIPSLGCKRGRSRKKETFSLVVFWHWLLQTIKWDNRYFWIKKFSWLIKATWPVKYNRIIFFLSYPANLKPGSCGRQITKNKN